jgi:hypothetical protein
LAQEGHQGKRTIFGDDCVFDLTSPAADLVRNEFERVSRLANEGVRSAHFYSDFLKDEVRPFAKVKAGKTRLVSGSPLVYSLCVRRFFMDFVDFMVSNRVALPPCIGINQYKEWVCIAEQIVSAGCQDTVVAGDFKNFDGSLSSQVLWSVYKIIEMWYGSDANNTGRRILWLEVVNSRHIRGNLMYEWHKGLPSGHPMTSVINSIANMVLFHYAWVLITRTSPVRFLTHNQLYVYGDDNLLAIGDDDVSVDKVNQHTLTAAFRRMGLTYTTENKDDEEVSTVRSLQDVSFLKRTFRYEDGHWYAPLDLQTILEIPMWCMNKSLLESITQTNIDTALIELSAHPREVWDTWAPRIIEESRRHGFAVLTTTREDNQAAYRGRVTPW